MFRIVLVIVLAVYLLATRTFLMGLIWPSCLLLSEVEKAAT